MKTRAVSMVLLMIASALAGCTSGDPDGDGDMGIDSELLDQLIQENLQDFINNTTVTVNNYHSSNETHQTYNSYNGSSEHVQQITVAAGTAAGMSTTNYNDTSNHEDLVLLVRNDRFANSSSGGSWTALDGANICVQVGGNTEGTMQNAFSSVSISFTSIPIADDAEGKAKFLDGSCDAITGTRNVVELWKNATSTLNSWITNAYGTGAIFFAIESWFDYTITQDYGMYVQFGQVHFEVTLFGTCVQNCASEDEDTSQLFIFDTFRYGGYGMYTNCYIDEYEELNYYSFEEQMLLAGLYCTMTFSAHAHIWGEDPNYEYTWSDWTYYIAWTETEVNMED